MYGLALFVVAIASNFSGFLVGMAISGLGFGVYAAVDLALVVDVLPGKRQCGQGSRGVQHRGQLFLLPSRGRSRRPSWRWDGGSYGVLYTVAGLCAIIGAAAILPIGVPGETGFRVTGCGSRQVEFRGPADRGAAVGHRELGVDVLGVSPDGVQGHHELAGDGRTVQLGSEQPEHVELAFAQWLDQGLLDRAVLLGLGHGRQELTDIVPAVCCLAATLSREAMGGPSSAKTRT